MQAALVRAGESVGRDQVAQLMRENYIRGEVSRQTVAHHDQRPGRVTAGGPVCRDFTAVAPDRLWVGDSSTALLGRQGAFLGLLYWMYVTETRVSGSEQPFPSLL